jgi:hypothetical protein
MHAQFTHEQPYIACLASGTIYVAGDLCLLHGKARVHGRGQHTPRQWNACMHTQFAHEQTYEACFCGGTGGVAGDRCILHGETRVHGRGQRASRRWRTCMQNSPMSRLTPHAYSAEQMASPEIFASCTGKRACMEGAGTHRGSGEHACMHAQFTLDMTRLTWHAYSVEQMWSLACTI